MAAPAATLGRSPARSRPTRPGDATAHAPQRAGARHRAGGAPDGGRGWRPSVSPSLQPRGHRSGPPPARSSGPAPCGRHSRSDECEEPSHRAPARNRRGLLGVADAPGGSPTLGARLVATRRVRLTGHRDHARTVDGLRAPAAVARLGASERSRPIPATLGPQVPAGRFPPPPLPGAARAGRCLGVRAAAPRYQDPRREIRSHWERRST